MWFLHDIIGRVLFQMTVLMLVFSGIQLIRKEGVNRLYFTGVLFTAGLAVLNGAIGFIGTVLTGIDPGPLHLAYGLVVIGTLPTIYYFERQSEDQRRALILYSAAFLVLTISVWRSLATAGT